MTPAEPLRPPGGVPLSVSQAAAIRGCGVRTVLRAIARGDLAAVLVGIPSGIGGRGARWCIDPAALDAWCGPRRRGRKKRHGPNVGPPR